MSSCEKCSNPLETGDLFCAECGHKVVINNLTCFECKKPISTQDKFCQNCGVPLGVENIASQNLLNKGENIANNDQPPVSKINLEKTNTVSQKTIAENPNINNSDANFESEEKVNLQKRNPTSENSIPVDKFSDPIEIEGSAPNSTATVSTVQTPPTPQNTSSSTLSNSKSSFGQKVVIFVAILMVISVANLLYEIGVKEYFHRLFAINVVSKPNVSDAKKEQPPQNSPNSTVPSTTRQETPKSAPNNPPPVAVVQQGSINGSDVILRSLPSIMGNELDYLQKNTIVTILEKNSCDDKNAAVINVDNKYVNYNGQRIHLPRGQAVQINSFDGRVYNCELKIANNFVYTSLYPSELRKIYGDIWYQVRLDSGKTGWVYGNYVTPL